MTDENSSHHPNIAGAPLQGKHSLETLWRLADRSQMRRDSYGARAEILIAAGAILAGGLAIILGSLPISAFLFSGVCLVVVVLIVSILLALSASGTISGWSGSSTQAGLAAGERPLFSPTDTFHKDSSYRHFEGLVDATDIRELLKKELFVSLTLQRRRYRLLRVAMRMMALSLVMFLFLAIGIAWTAWRALV